MTKEEKILLDAVEAATGVITISTVKKLAAYHQYYAVNAAVASTVRAAGARVSGVAESPESYGVSGVKDQPSGDRKAGVVWHTQGSGKSLSMVFYTGKIICYCHSARAGHGCEG